MNAIEPAELSDLFEGWSCEVFGVDLDRLAGAFADARPNWSKLGGAIQFAPAGYQRRILLRTGTIELILASWLPGQRTAIHDHGGSEGVSRVLSGVLQETRFAASGDFAQPVSTQECRRGAVLIERPTTVHEIFNHGSEPALSIHLYRPPLIGMRVYRPLAGA